jgi:hypothetical protein
VARAGSGAQWPDCGPPRPRSSSDGRGSRPLRKFLLSWQRQSLEEGMTTRESNGRAPHPGPRAGTDPASPAGLARRAGRGHFVAGAGSRPAPPANARRGEEPVVRESQNQPLLLVFEDLHWIDAETQALLDFLVDPDYPRGLAPGQRPTSVTTAPRLRGDFGPDSIRWSMPLWCRLLLFIGGSVVRGGSSPPGLTSVSSRRTRPRNRPLGPRKGCVCQWVFWARGMPRKGGVGRRVRLTFPRPVRFGDFLSAGGGSAFSRRW